MREIDKEILNEIRITRRSVERLQEEQSVIGARIASIEAAQGVRREMFEAHILEDRAAHDDLKALREEAAASRAVSRVYGAVAGAFSAVVVAVVTAALTKHLG